MKNILGPLSFLFLNLLSFNVGATEITAAEYRFNAVYDDEILIGQKTEIWGRMTRPKSLGNQAHPVVILLHGNHPTCQSDPGLPWVESCFYTFTGSCPSGQSVVNNHQGFEYLANRLAEQGYIVISINANRGITCGEPRSDDFGLNLARGKLVLRHLALLSQWNQFGNAPNALNPAEIQGKIDLSEVGLLGHSRGGEGVRAAYHLYRSASTDWKRQILVPMTIRGIFEIAPVDGQTSVVLNAYETAWNVLLPSCDGDVVSQSGIKPFDRMMGQKNNTDITFSPKSFLVVHGANHNFFNTEWTASDSPGCQGMSPLWSQSGGPELQRETAIQSVLPFFLAHVGKGRNAAEARYFDPLTAAPASPSLQSILYERGYSHSASEQYYKLLDDFTNVHYVTSAAPEISAQIVQPAEHSTSMNALQLTWSGANPGVYVDLFFSENSGLGVNLNSDYTLDFRAGLTSDALNSVSLSNFSIQLFDDLGIATTAVPVSNFVNLSRPIGIPSALHVFMPSVRIPVQLFSIPSGRKIKGMRFVFDQVATGQVWISQVAVSRFKDPVLASAFIPLQNGPVDPANLWRTQPLAQSPTEQARIQRVSLGDQQAAGKNIEVFSEVAFQVRNALPVLQLNGKIVAVGKPSRNSIHRGDLRYMSFDVLDSDIDSLPEQFNGVVLYQEDAKRVTRNLGQIEKSSIRL
jgi:hypothetical protein